jgi:hypothetical protein
MTRAAWHTPYNGFETQSLLDAATIDELRDHLKTGKNSGPPNLRSNLIELHTRAIGRGEFRASRAGQRHV